MTLIVLLLTLCAATTSGFAHANYTGRSGAPGRNTCASSCHGSGGGTVQISGFPAEYSPGQSYLITIQKLTGSNISNFNASCRVGTGTTNAGEISAGTSTAAYNVSGETNGIHFSSNNHASGTFNWQAPSSGTGTVRLYCGALQGSYGGQNSTLVLVSNEATGGLPDPATNPIPTHLAVDQEEPIVLGWVAGGGAESHDVYFGTANPPVFMINQTVTTWDPPNVLTPGTTYFWRVDERNSSGVAAGPVWQFTMGVPPEAPQRVTLYPHGGGMQLRWHGVSVGTEYRIYRAITQDVGRTPPNLIATTSDSTFTDTSSPSPAGYYVVTAFRP